MSPMVSPPTKGEYSVDYGSQSNSEIFFASRSTSQFARHESNYQVSTKWTTHGGYEHRKSRSCPTVISVTHPEQGKRYPTYVKGLLYTDTERIKSKKTSRMRGHHHGHRAGIGVRQ